MKKKIVLLNAGDLVAYGYSPSLGIAYIKSFLLSKFRNKISVDIVRKEIFSTIVSQKPDLIGINSNSNNYQDAVNFAYLIREYLKDVKIVIGGVHITVLPKSFNVVFDYGIIGEGELVMQNLIQNVFFDNISNLAKIDGLVYKDKNNIVFNKEQSLISDLNDVPNIDRSDFQDSNYHYILTSRGCPFNCLFCATDKIWKSKKIRYFSALHIYKEIKSLYEFNIKDINISDDMFLSNINRLKELVELIEADRIICGKIRFSITTKADFVSDEIGYLLKRLGCTTIKTGLESTSEILYRKFRNSDFKLFGNMLNVIKRHGIGLILNLNLNNPWQDHYEYFKIYDFLKKNKINVINIYLAEPYPGSYYWEYALKEKIIDKNFNLLRLNIIGHKSVDDISEKDIIPFSKFISNYDLVFWIKKINSLAKKNNRKIVNIIFNKLNKKITTLIGKVSVFKKAHSEFPKNIRWIITKKCNLNCEMCLNKKLRLENPIEDVRYLKIQDQFAEISEHKANLILYGGEPTMNKELTYLIRSAFLNKINTTCYTNLVNSKSNMDDYIYFGLKNFYISLDHFDHFVHNKIRNCVGCFEKTTANITYLIELKNKNKVKINITIATVVVKQNYETLSQMYDFVESLGGVDYWNLRHNTFYYKNKHFYLNSNDKYKIQDLNGQIVSDEHFFNYDELSTFGKELGLINKKTKQFLTKLDIKKDISENLIEYYYKNNFSKANCGEFLDNNVKILGDDFQIDCGYSLGKIGKGKSLKEMWNSKKNRDFQSFVEKNKIPQCFRCPRVKYKF